MIQKTDFLRHLASSNFKEQEVGIKILWLMTKLSDDDGEVFKVSQLIEELKVTGLRGNINASRFFARIRGSKDTISHGKDGVVLSLPARMKFDKDYASFLTPQAPIVESGIVEIDRYERCKKYTKEIIRQINSCYQFHSYDACGVLMRRLVESLLIDAFEATDEASLIKSSGEYHQLKKIIAIAKTGSSLNLSRTSRNVLDNIKGVGDKAAHHRSYITSKRDIDDLKLEYRPLVEDLVQISLPV